MTTKKHLDWKRIGEVLAIAFFAIFPLAFATIGLYYIGHLVLHIVDQSYPWYWMLQWFVGALCLVGLAIIYLLVRFAIFVVLFLGYACNSAFNYFYHNGKEEQK